MEDEPAPLAIATATEMVSPESYNEMIINLEENGIDTIIQWTGGWTGRKGLSYTDAIKLAKKAQWVGVEKDVLGFVFWLDGDFWIWHNELVEQPYTGFEKCEIQTAIVTLDAYSNWKVQIQIKNSGSIEATITNVYVNDVEVSEYGASEPTNAVGTITSDLTVTTPFTIVSEQSGTVTVWIGESYGSLSSGTTINLKLHSAGGMDYIKLIQLT